MAKQADGHTGGYRGRLGQTVGYVWNGIYCVRALPSKMPNPKSAAQVEHRTLFKQQVQLASRMHWVLREGMTVAARAAGMTAHNLFVRLNQQAFSLEEGELRVDYARLRVAEGGLAPVGFGAPSLSAEGVLTVDFAKNPEHRNSDSFDSAHLYLYCPEMGEGFVSNGDYRRTGRCAVVVPSWMMGKEVHVYGYVRNSKGICSASSYIGSLTPVEGVAQEAVAAEAQAEAAEAPTNGEQPRTMVDEATGEIITTTSTSKKPTPPKRE